MEVKDHMKFSVTQINRLETSNAAPINSDIDDVIRFPLKKKARTGVLSS